MHSSGRPNEITPEPEPAVGIAAPPAAAATAASPDRAANLHLGNEAPGSADDQKVPALRCDEVSTARFQQNRQINALCLKEQKARVVRAQSVYRRFSFSTMSIAADVAFLISCQPVARRQPGKCKIRA